MPKVDQTESGVARGEPKLPDGIPLVEHLRRVVTDDEAKSLDESPADEVAWDRPASAADAWHAKGAEVRANDSVVEPTSDAWSDASASDAAADEPNPWNEKVSSPAAIDASTFGEDDGASLAQQPVDKSRI